MAEIWDDIAEEFLHLYPSGPRLLAVAGADAERSASVADALAAALERRGTATVRSHSDDDHDAVLRAAIVEPFRREPQDRVLVVSGPAGLLSGAARGLWHFSVWQLVGEEQPHTAASVLVDVTDRAAPVRRFADYCAMPSAFLS